MSEKWAFSSEFGGCAIISEPDFRMFAELLSRDFERVVVTGYFVDGVRFEASEVSKFIAQMNQQDRRLERLTIEASSVGGDVSTGGILQGHLRLTLARGYRSTGEIDFTYTGDRFFKIRDYIQQYIQSVRPWYAPAYSFRGSAKLAIETVLGVLLMVVMFRAGVRLAFWFQPKEVVEAWVEAVVRSSSSFFLLFLIVGGWGICSLLLRVFEHVYPPFVLGMGSEKKRQEQMREVRKWTLTSVGSTFLAVLWLAFGLK